MGSQDRVAVVHVGKYLDGNDRLCHHDCLFCMERMEPGNSNEQLPSVADIACAVQHYSEMKGAISQIYVAGGEPTLRKDFAEIIRIIQPYCHNIVLSTGCDYDNEDAMVYDIVELGIRNIATSIHSHSAATHDRLTGCPGSFDRTMSAIKKFIDAGVSVTVNSVINSFNVPEMNKIVRCFKEAKLKIEKLTLTHYMHHGNAYYHDELRFNADECSEILGSAVSAAEQVDYVVTFRDFPLCLDDRLALRQEVVENIDIINLKMAAMEIVGEKAPSFTKKKCCQCNWFDKCPHYLTANYGEG